MRGVGHFAFGAPFCQHCEPNVADLTGGSVAAAAFDRLERADGSVVEDPRMARLREALTTLLEQPSDRAEQVQMIFSRPYEDDWQKKFKVGPR